MKREQHKKLATNPKQLTPKREAGEVHMKQSISLRAWAVGLALVAGAAASCPIFGTPLPFATWQSQATSPQAAESPGSSAPGSQTSGPSEADAREYKNYRLDMNNVNKYLTATKAILKLMNDNPTLRKELESQRDVPTIDEAVKTTEKYPEVTAGIESAGLTTRDYVVIAGTLTGAMMAVDMRKQGQIKAYPTTILPENIAFVEKNYQKLKSMMRVLQADQDQE